MLHQVHRRRRTQRRAGVGPAGERSRGGARVSAQTVTAPTFTAHERGGDTPRSRGGAACSRGRAGPRRRERVGCASHGETQRACKGRRCAQERGAGRGRSDLGCSLADDVPSPSQQEPVPPSTRTGLAQQGRGGRGRSDLVTETVTDLVTATKLQSLTEDCASSTEVWSMISMRFLKVNPCRGNKNNNNNNN